VVTERKLHAINSEKEKKTLKKNDKKSGYTQKA